MSNFFIGKDEETIIKNEGLEKTQGVEKTVITDVNVREAPGGNVIGARHPLDTVVVMNEEGGWSQLKDGGFILSSLLR